MGLNPAKCWAFLLFSILSVVSPQFRSLEELQHYWFSYKISFAVQLEAKKPFKLTRSFCYHAFCIFLDRSWAWTWKMGRPILYSSKRAKGKPWETSSTSTLCKVCQTRNCQNCWFLWVCLRREASFPSFSKLWNFLDLQRLFRFLIFLHSKAFMFRKNIVGAFFLISPSFTQTVRTYFRLRLKVGTF